MVDIPMNHTILYSTTPNGHFGSSVSVSEDTFEKINQIINDSSSPKTENGFNCYKEEAHHITVGYNHYLSIKHLLF